MTAINKSQSLTHQVTEQLGKAIVSGSYNTQNPVPSEAKLCEQMNVSRSAAREAVKSLAAKGLISSRARQGITIKAQEEWNLFDSDVLRWIRESNPSLDLIREFTQLRAVVEPEAAVLAAQRQDHSSIGKIRSALERMQHAERGFDDPLESDIDFHNAVLRASGNRFFWQLRRITDANLRVSIRFTNKRAGKAAASYEEHKLIYDAILAGNAEQAREHSKNLMQTALSLIEEACKEEACEDV